ncbi:MAG: DivIVA domain-containing protein [Eubacterium sp.]|nr:DivIVA domain-containing protein [Eubacterium sp.]
MMQPLDIRSQSFGKGLFGYKKTDVDQYVDTVYRAYDELFTENKNLRDERDKLKKVIEDNNVKIFDLENNASGVVDTSKADAEAEKIIAEARKTAAEILERAKTEGDKIAGGSSSGTVDSFADAGLGNDAKADDKSQSATSKFFQQSNDDVFGGDGDDVFVGEIEEARKPNKVMIGDGEEESDDFEFL